MQQWEYATLTTDMKSLLAELTKHGLEGWELASIITFQSMVGPSAMIQAVFKRPLAAAG